MRLLILVLITMLSSCAENSTTKKTPQDDTTQQAPISSDFTTVSSSKAEQQQTALEMEINKLLEAKFQGQWHVLNDRTAKWMKDEFDYFIAPKRKENPDYPYISKGDYNADGKPDYAALITDDKKTSYQIAILLADGTITLWKEDVDGAALENLPKMDVLGFEGEKEKKVKLKSDGINVVFYEKSSYVIYWNGSSFKNVWTGD